MKKLIFTLLIAISALFVVSQEWEKNYPKEKVENGTLTFFDIQKAFYDYCAELNVKDGYYYEDGKLTKLQGYKRFKKWEYHWQYLVDPVTGEFPSITGEDIINASINWKNTSAKSWGDWENIGISDNKRVGRVNCIAFHPNNKDVIYAGTPGAGLWKTTDHGSTWSCLTDDCPTLGVSAIALVPKPGGDIIYIGTGDKDGDDTYSVGVLKSTDGGITWNTTGLAYNVADQKQVSSLKVHPADENIIYATTSDGFYRTMDGGITWPKKFDLSKDINFIDMEVHPLDPKCIYISSTRKNKGGTDGPCFIYRSTDMGKTWDVIFWEESDRIELAISTNPAEPIWLYAVVNKPDENLEGIYKFINGGLVTIEAENFNLSWGSWTTYSYWGDEVWDRDNTSGIDDTPCASIGGYTTSSANNDWLISPSLDLDVFMSNKEYLSFENALEETGGGGTLELLYSTDYTGGDPTLATWAVLDFIHSSGSWTWVYSGEIDLSGISGSNVHLAFKFSDAGPDADRFGLDDIEIKRGNYIQRLNGDYFNLLGDKKNGQDFDDNQQSNYDMAIAVDPTDGNILYVGGITTFKSEDGGHTWKWESFDDISQMWRVPGKPRTHADIHQLIFHPGTSDSLYECNDGGIFLRKGKRNWEGISEGMVISQMHNLGLNKYNSEQLLAGLQDNGSHKYEAGGWKRIFHSDGFECIIDYEKSNIQYASAQEGKIARTKRSWSGWNPNYIVKKFNLLTWSYEWKNDFGENEEAAWSTPYAMGPNHHKTLYLGLKNVWKSTNKGNAWTVKSDLGTDAPITSLAVSQTHPDYIYIFNQDDEMFRTKDGATTDWESINAPCSDITYITVKASEPETVWVTRSGFQSNNVRMSTDAGDSWIDISDDLPEIPVYCIIQNTANESEDELYIGTYSGVYRKIGDLEWEPYNSGFPNVPVRELEIFYLGDFIPIQYLYAATYGRGMWKTMLEISYDYRLWTGEESTVWDNPNNWHPNLVPTPSTNVYIPKISGACYYPITDKLELGVDCNNLRMYDEAELSVTGDLLIGSEKKLTCDSLSILYIGGMWTNDNDAAMVTEGYGFLPESTSTVIFTFQTVSPLYALNGSETFKNLVIEKPIQEPPAYFNPMSQVIVEEQCTISTGIWQDLTVLNHKMYQDFRVYLEGVYHAQPGGILEFVGTIPQSIYYVSNSSDNSIQTIKVNGVKLIQETDLNGTRIINGDLIIQNGVYYVGQFDTWVEGQVLIGNGASLQLHKTTFNINNLLVEEGGLFHSSGTGSNNTKITRLSAPNYSFKVYGIIECEYTSFIDMGSDGIYILETGEIGSVFENCTFSSTASGATMMKIDNDQEIFTLNNLTFNFNTSDQKTVTKTVEMGHVEIRDWAPPWSPDYEDDFYNLIDWPPEEKSNIISNDGYLKDMESDEIKVYPNPNSGSFTIENNLNSTLRPKLEITDLEGRLIYESFLDPGNSTINTSGFQKGIYILKVFTGDFYFYAKIVNN